MLPHAKHYAGLVCRAMLSDVVKALGVGRLSWPCADAERLASRQRLASADRFALLAGYWLDPNV